MATSFAAYASQYLNRQHATASAAMSSSSSQPMFFSFNTDDDGSRHRGDADLDDFDDPHLNMGESLGMGSGALPEMQEQDDEDPYLRLDEDPHVAAPRTASSSRMGFRQHQEQQQSIPLIARSASPASPPGWLAHLAQSPRRSPSPASSSNSDSSPPADLLVASPQGHPRAPSKPTANARPPSIPPPPRATEAHSLSLTDSLLPRDGRTRPLDVFSLPDPLHTPLKRRKHHDSPYIALFLGLLSCCLFFCVLLLLTTDRPKGVPAVILPYAIMLRTVPVLVILTCASAVAAYAHVYLLRIFVGPVMLATGVFVPATLFVCAVWAFVGSFMWDGDTVPTWGETVGLRLFSLVPLVLCLLTARRLLHLPRQIHTTSSVLTLSTHILIAHPFLLALSPLLLICMLLVSIPFITLVFRLLLIGYTTDAKSGVEWHVRAWANWAIALVLAVWFWSWAVARGVLRTTAAGVVGSWYFADPSLPPPPPASTHTIHAALTRSAGPSLGSIILGALILTLLRLLTLTILVLARLPPLLLRIPWVPLAVPVAVYVVPGVRILTVWLERKAERVSGYALVYVGLTGVAFWEGAGRGGALVGSGVDRVVEDQERDEEVQGQGRRGGRRQGRNQAQPTPRVQRKNRFSAEPPLALLTISPLTLTFPFSLITYLFVAHTLRAPNEALGAALLAGATTAVVGLFCVGVVRDVADTLYICYCIDKAAGERRREEVFVAFEYDAGSSPSNNNNTNPTILPLHHARNQPQPQQRGQRRGQQQHPSMPKQPETIIPRSPLSRRTENSAGTGLGASAVGAVLFDIGAADPDSDSTSEAGGPAATVRYAQGQQGRKERKDKKRAPPPPHLTEPYRAGSDSSLEDEVDQDQGGRTARPRDVVPGARGRQDRRAEVNEEEGEEDDLDPFRNSRHVDEEALLEGLGGGRRSGAGSTSGSPGAAVHGFRNLNMNMNMNLGLPQGGLLAQGHRRSASGGAGAGVTGGGGGGQQQRMMTSTQELNMKSQFLMNMRAYGGESGGGVSGSAGFEAGSRVGSQEGSGVGSQLQEGSRMGVEGVEGERMGGSVRGEGLGEEGDGDGDGEESVLGPGSDFFN